MGTENESCDYDTLISGMDVILSHCHNLMERAAIEAKDNSELSELLYHRVNDLEEVVRFVRNHLPPWQQKEIESLAYFKLSDKEQP
jgi:hypothetical protein